MYCRLADSSQTMKSFSSVVELSSKLISDNFYVNFETLRLFSIRYNDYDIDKWDFCFLSSVPIFRDKNEMCQCIVLSSKMSMNP